MTVARKEKSDIDWKALDRNWNIHLTTIGRKTGKPRRITAWFAVEEGKIYMGGGPHKPNWARNIEKHPDVEVEIGGVRFKGRARVLKGRHPIDHMRRLIYRKYLIARLGSFFGAYKNAVPVQIDPVH
jgi:deazaflavin-dependent oxidoreductase (nitroreductase family)